MNDQEVREAAHREFAAEQERLRQLRDDERIRQESQGEIHRKPAGWNPSPPQVNLKPEVDERAQLLKDALGIVTGDRAAVYGGPEDNFKRISKLQDVYLQLVADVRYPYFELTPEDVAILNILQKIGRLVQSPDHRDSWLDIAGYAACGYSCTLVDDDCEVCGE